MKKNPANMVGAGIAIGAAIGVAIDNVGLGIALGLAIGAGMVTTQKKKTKWNASGSNKKRSVSREINYFFHITKLSC